MYVLWWISGWNRWTTIQKVFSVRILISHFNYFITQFLKYPNTYNSIFIKKTYLISRVAEALILGTMMVGQASAFQPNYNKAVIAAGRIFKLLDRKPLIDSASGDDASGLRLVCKCIWHYKTVDCRISAQNIVLFIERSFSPNRTLWMVT